MLQEAIETISTAIEKFPKKWDVPPTHSHARTDARKHEHTLARSLTGHVAVIGECMLGSCMWGSIGAKNQIWPLVWRVSVEDTEK